jgi:hypothetical protein
VNGPGQKKEPLKTGVFRGSRVFDMFANQSAFNRRRRLGELID